jgi:hypothetical protein
MADIKTPPEEAQVAAMNAVARAASEAKDAIDRAAQAALDELAVREASIASLSGLVERCKHVLVKDVGIEHRDAVALSEIYVHVGRYQQLRFVEYQGDREKAPHLHTYEEPNKNYRIWLCIEELP